MVTLCQELSFNVITTYNETLFRYGDSREAKESFTNNTKFIDQLEILRYVAT